MPELPEVQTVVDDLLGAGLAGDTIQRAQPCWPGTIAAPAPELFCQRIAGRQIRAIGRRAKYIVIELDGALTLLIHLRMSGRLALAPHGTAPGRHDRILLHLHRLGQLHFHDPRKFGRMHLVTDSAPLLGHLGPEPLAAQFSAARFAAMLATRQRALKPLLLDQHFLAGLGNIYVDEALWEASLHPLQPASSLNRQQAAKLHRAIRRVLRRGLASGGTQLGDGPSNFQSVHHRDTDSTALRVFQRQGQPCPRCGGTLTRLVVAQRGTHVCPRCQAAPSQEAP